MYSRQKKLVSVKLSEIHSATNNFTEGYLAEGSFGKVHKAKLPSFPDQDNVAIKMLNPLGRQGVGEFQNEIELLSHFDHPNLISLLGFCDEGSKKALVYEFAANGSLEDHIGPDYNLPYMRRLQICLGAARGFAYLHEGVGENERIIHRDIKCANILLDHNWQAKVADFGLSKVAPANRPVGHVSSHNVAGTRGYVDPQYVKTGVLKKESDVYSFGVVLLEVFCGELTHDPLRANDEELASIARNWYYGKLHEIFDPGLKDRIRENYSINNDGINKDSLDVFSAIIDKCLKVKQAERPTMRDVELELDKALTFQCAEYSMERKRLSYSWDASNPYSNWANKEDSASCLMPNQFTGEENSMEESLLQDLERISSQFYQDGPKLEPYMPRIRIKNLNDLRMSLNDILRATNNFDAPCEEFGTGRLYKGQISNYKGHHTVHIYRINATDSGFKDGREFYELLEDVFGKYMHKTITSILGFCREKDEFIMVYEYASNGSMASHLVKNDSSNFSFTWIKRLKACASIADALCYLESRDICAGMELKTENILLNYTWDAKIFGCGTEYFRSGVGFVPGDQLGMIGLYYPRQVFSLGVILFEILCGKRAEFYTNGGNCTLYQFVGECIKSDTLTEIVDPNMRGQIESPSIGVFIKIMHQCLNDKSYKRPDISVVLKELNLAVLWEESYEWMPKVPKAFKEIMDMAKTPMVGQTFKDLYYLLYDGVRLKYGNFFSLNEQGHSCEMVPAARFSNQNLRFPKVAKMLDLSNLKLHVKIHTKFLSSEIDYAAYLVFRFRERKKITDAPIYVQLRYKVEEESKIAYFAEWRGIEWMHINLFHVCKENVNADVEVLLEGMSSFYCGSSGIYVKGIQFLPVENVGIEATQKLGGEKNVESLWKPGWEFDLPKKQPTIYHGIIKRSENLVQDADNSFLSGIHADNGQKSFPWCNVNGKKCHMLPATAVLLCEPSVMKRRKYPSVIKRFKWRPLPISRFEECVEILSYHEFCLKYEIGAHMLSPDTAYACYLVYTISEKCRGLESPVKVRYVLSRKAKEAISSYSKREKGTINVYLRSPSLENAMASVRCPTLRRDGWMEVVVSEFNFQMVQNRDHIPMNIKLISLDRNMAGLILYGIEFRPVYVQ